MSSSQYGTNVGGIFYDVAFETQQVIDGRRTIERELDLGAKAFNKITQAISLYAAALAVVKSAQAADDIRLLGARVQVAAGNIEKGAAALAELERISARTQTRIAENAAVFSRLNSSIVQMGGTQQDTLRLTELLAMGIKVSGASAAEASAAMLQFGQALASGKLQGDELRSLLENAPYLMQRLAEGIGVPVGQLRKLGEEGKLTADVITQALGKAAAQIESDFKKLPQTFDAALGGAEDAAKRANEAFDTLTGTSATLTGIAKGTGTALDLLAQYFRDATTEADKLGRNESVKSWAETTTVVLTYVVDAADFVRRGFLQMGNGIAGVAASVAAAARGEFTQAKNILGELGDKLQAIGNAKYAGQAMRESLALARVEDRGFTPGGGFSPLKSAGGGDSKGSKFDAAGYIAKLEQAAAEGMERVDIIEQEALRKNAELLAQGKVNAEQAEKAKTLIEVNAAQDRMKLAFQAAEERRQWIEEEGKKDVEQAKRLAEERARGIKLAEDTVVGGDPVQRIILEAQRKSDALMEAAQRDQANAQLYADARVALERQTAQRLQEIRDKEQQQRLETQIQSDIAAYAAAQSAAGQLVDLLRNAGKERTAIGKAVFLAERALAVATIIANTEMGAAKAIGIAGPFGIPLASIIRATGYASAGMVAGLALSDAFGGGRQYGGETAAGKLYRVNETGRPEMFTGANGAQYMLPTQRGSVTAAAEVGAATAWTININGAPPGTTASVDESARIIDIAVGQAVDTVAGQIGSNNGKVWSALKSSTNVQSKL